ncbi:replication stress response regulator SDE2 [Cheilinus undulatus]|uniref:replication stress response regulator SDE2 n=1 Tax=Cheilinus undulatus TaxID=241271 RepID=UPI001BD1E168|nr:replication stress response regulator SDE2 [Cheilinus undulatus]
MEVFVNAPSFRCTNVQFPVGSVVRDVLNRFIHSQGGSSSEDFYVVRNGRLSDLDDPLLHGAVYHLELRLCGGKGGFGSMLRALGAQIEKTTNREACRDLSGRRLRDVNHEKEMAEWLKKQAEREAEKEQRRLERLQRKLAEPKHYFTDPEYQQQCHDLSERLEDSVIKGLQASSSSQVKADDVSAVKRASADQSEQPQKKKRKTTTAAAAACFWTGVGELPSSEDDEDDDGDEEGDESPSTSSSSCGAAAVAMTTHREEESEQSSSSSVCSSSSIQNIRPPETSKEPNRPLPEDQRLSDEQEASGPSQQLQNGMSQEDGSLNDATSAEVCQTGMTLADASQTNVTPTDVSQTSVTQADVSQTSVTQADVSQTSVTQADVSQTSVTQADVSQTSVTQADVSQTSVSPAGASQTGVSPADASHVDLSSVSSPSELEALGLDVLKAELMSRGLKCGGTLAERAARLFSVRGLTPDQIDPALLAKPSKSKRK